MTPIEDDSGLGIIKITKSIELDQPSIVQIKAAEILQEIEDSDENVSLCIEEEHPISRESENIPISFLAGEPNTLDRMPEPVQDSKLSYSDVAEVEMSQLYLDEQN